MYASASADRMFMIREIKEAMKKKERIELEATRRNEIAEGDCSDGQGGGEEGRDKGFAEASWEPDLT